MNAQTYEARISFRWWVPPLLKAAVLWALCGLPLDTGRIGIFVARFGLRTELVPKP